VQVYASTPGSSVPAPRTRLVAFERVENIQPGQKVVVELTVAPESHAVVIPAESVYTEQLQVEAGALVLSVGGAQPGTGTAPSDNCAHMTVQVADTSMLHLCGAPPPPS
jgi:hypothetical protein